jgi:DNA-binding PadR family transcriptional regulator
MRRTGQPSGTLYPILAKLEHAGWLVGGKEDIDPHAEGRPARRTYRITGAAIAVARTQLAALSEQYRPPVPIRARVAPEGGPR